MQILISGAAPDFVHGHHPEVISVDTERTNSLLEREFDRNFSKTSGRHYLSGSLLADDGR
jgi:hypothetical protein